MRYRRMTLAAPGPERCRAGGVTNLATDGEAGGRAGTQLRNIAFNLYGREQADACRDAGGLLLELRRQVDATDAVWLEGHALSFERSTALYPLIDMLRRSFGIEEADAGATMVAKIEQALVRHGEALRADLPYLRYLLGADPRRREPTAHGPAIAPR